MTRRASLISWLMVLIVAPCRASDSAWVDPGALPSAGGWAGDAGQRGHGWFVGPVYGARPSDDAADASRPFDPTRWLLVHLPPREVGARTGVAPGGARVALGMQERPVAISAHADRLFLLHRGRDATSWRLGAIRTSAGPTPSLWLYDPPMRTTALPPPPEGELRGFAASSTGPALLLDRDGALTLHALMRGRWWSVALPNELEPDVELLSEASGFALASLASGRVWRASPAPPERSRLQAPDLDDRGSLLDGASRSLLDSSVADGPELIGASWVIDHVAPAPPTGSARHPWMSELGPAWVERDGDRWVVYAASASAIKRVAEIDRVGPWGAIVPMVGERRLVAAWPEAMTLEAWSELRAQQRALVGSPRGYQVAELSLDSGAVLFRGPVNVAAPLSATEFRVLAVLLVATMALVLVFALQRDPADGVASLPAGVAMAEPMRRAMASVIDAALSLSIVAAGTGQRMSALVDLDAWLTGAHAVWILPLTLLIGMTIGTLGEWLLGRSLGKLAMGCEVVSVVAGEGSRRRLTLWRSIVRNAFKWILPPGAMLAFVTPGFRHRGDVVARAAVVRPIAPPEA